MPRFFHWNFLQRWLQKSIILSCYWFQFLGENLKCCKLLVFEILANIAFKTNYATPMLHARAQFWSDEAKFWKLPKKGGDKNTPPKKTGHQRISSVPELTTKLCPKACRELVPELACKTLKGTPGEAWGSRLTGGLQGWGKRHTSTVQQVVMVYVGIGGSRSITILKKLVGKIRSNKNRAR